MLIHLRLVGNRTQIGDRVRIKYVTAAQYKKGLFKEKFLLAKLPDL